MRSLAFLTLVFAATVAPAAAAGDPPYLKLAEALGTPHLAAYDVPADHSQEQFQFTAPDQSAESFKKLTTVTILKVAETSVETEAAERGVIVRLRDGIASRKADILSFDESPSPPVTLYYEFSGDGDHAAGIVYSPRLGYVTAVQIDAKNGGSISPGDIAQLKAVLTGAK